jgi:putative flippase GtrA
MSKLKELFNKHRHFILYAMSGCVNTVVDFGVFTLLNVFTPLALAFCQAGGYIAGVISSFILNRNVTFKDGRNTGIFSQLWRFICVNGVSLLVSTFGIQWLTSGGLNDYIAKVIILVITTLINYVGYKLLVFKVKS